MKMSINDLLKKYEETKNAKGVLSQKEIDAILGGKMKVGKLSAAVLDELIMLRRRLDEAVMLNFELKDIIRRMGRFL